MQESLTGRHLTPRHGAHSAVIVELGAALRSYAVGERTVIDGFAEQDRITRGRGQILVPWPNRICDGRYLWTGSICSCRSPNRSAATPSTACSDGSPGGF